MPQGSYKKSKCEVPKLKDRHKEKLLGLKKGGNIFYYAEICYEYYTGTCLILSFNMPVLVYNGSGY